MADVLDPHSGGPGDAPQNGDYEARQHEERHASYETEQVPVAEAPSALSEPPDTQKPAPAVAEAILDAGRNRALELASLFAAQAGQTPGEGNKRKLEDQSSADAPDYKRSAGDGHGLGAGAETSSIVPPSSFLFALDAGNITETVMCPSEKVGRVIGRAGATIRDLEANTSTRIQVDHKAPGEKPVTISGRREDVERAKRTVQDLISGSGEPAPVSGEVQKNVECPQGIVGRVIGRGGETIRALQQASGAHILVNQEFPDGVPRQITISGSHEAVERATNMVTELISGDHANTQAVIQRFGVGSTEVLECPKAMVGRIIGKGGETIKDLQKRFSVSIQIEQNSHPCKVTITGPAHTITSARRAVEELVRPNNGGGPMPGGGSRSGPGPSYNAPYSQPPYQGGSPYGQPAYGGYGMPPHGNYLPQGGYPGYGAYPSYPPAVPPYQGYGNYSAPGPDPYASGAGGYGPHSGYPGANQSAQQAPAAAPAPAASSPWQALQDDQGRTYYYNSQTGVSQWEKPSDMP